MKKLMLGATAIVAMSFATSCSETCHKCQGGSLPENMEYCADEYTAEELSDIQEACEFGGGTWN